MTSSPQKTWRCLNLSCRQASWRRPCRRCWTLTWSSDPLWLAHSSSCCTCITFNWFGGWAKTNWLECDLNQRPPVALSIDFKFSWLSHWSVGSSPGHDTCFPRAWYSNVNTSLHPGVSVYLWEQEMVFGIDVAWSATYLAAHAVLSTNRAI